MPIATPPQVVCTPYLGRTYKGWTVRVRICFALTVAEVAATTIDADIQNVTVSMGAILSNLSYVPYAPSGGANVVAPLGVGTAGDFADAEDVVEFSFLSSQGTVLKVAVPAPLDTIFLGDKQTVNPANAAVLAFTNAMTTQTIGAVGSFGQLGSKSGAYATTFIGGLRVRRPTRRRMTLFVKDPTHTVPAI